MITNADEQLLSIVQRVEHLHAEREELAGDVSEIFAEAKGSGYDVRALKAVIAERRRQVKDPVKFEEMQALLELYRARLGMDSATRAGAGE